MARPGWYNDNVNRSFPFMSGTVARPITGSVISPYPMQHLPDYVIADCGFTLGGQSTYEDGTDVVYLESITRSGSLFVFTFKASDSTTSAYVLTFTRAIDADLYELSYSDSDFPHLADSISDSVPVDCQRPFWSGYLVTGDMERFADLLADGESFQRGSQYPAHPYTRGGRVEPALVQNLSNTIVNSIGLANGDRTRAKNATGCDEYSWPFPTDCGDGERCVYAQTDCVKGDVRFEPGYNMAIAANVATNTITFSVAVGAGKGTPCDTDNYGSYNGVPLFPGETLPDDDTSSVFGGGPLCNELIRTINGLGGPLFQFKAGQGVVIRPVPEEHKIVIDIDLNNLDLCQFSEYSIG